MVACAMAVPANKTPTSDDAIAHRSVFIVRDLSINREVDVSTEGIRVTLRPADKVLGTALVRRRVKLISVTIAINRDREKPGLNRKVRKSAPIRPKGVKSDKPCRLHKMSGSAFSVVACCPFWRFGLSGSFDSFVKVMKQPLWRPAAVEGVVESWNGRTFARSATRAGEVERAE